MLVTTGYRQHLLHTGQNDIRAIVEAYLFNMPKLFLGGWREIQVGGPLSTRSVAHLYTLAAFLRSSW